MCWVDKVVNKNIFGYIFSGYLNITYFSFWFMGDKNHMKVVKLML